MDNPFDTVVNMETKPAAAMEEVINPATGVVVDLQDVDSVLKDYEETKKILDEMRYHERLLRKAAWGLTNTGNKTRHLRGGEYQAKVVQGKVSPVQSILKEAWNSYPQFRDQYLRGRLHVDLQMREFNKARQTTTTDPALQQLFSMMNDAYENGTEGSPSLSVSPVPPTVDEQEIVDSL